MVKNFMNHQKQKISPNTMTKNEIYLRTSTHERGLPNAHSRIVVAEKNEIYSIYC